MSEPFFSINCPNTEYGEIRCDGQLGYEDHAFKVLPHLNGGVIISAHADSSFLLQLRSRARLCGVLDVTSNAYRKEPCRFFINGGLLGYVYTAVTPTVFIDLPSGNYELRIEAIKNNYNAHTGWCLIPNHSDNTADLITEENTLFAVCCNYQENDPNAPDRGLKQTSAKAGIHWCNTFAGRVWKGNYRHKIVDNLNEYIKAYNAGKRFVLFIDARDGLIRHTLSIVLGRLNELYRHGLKGKILFAADAFGYNVPFEIKSWRYLLHKKLREPQVFANSGTYFGEIERVLEMLTYSVKAYDAMRNGVAFDEGTTFLLEHTNKYARGRDQGYIQLYHMMYPDQIKLDVEKEMFACITSDLRPKTEPTRYHPILSHTICDASFIHAPLPTHNTERWKKMIEMILNEIDVQ
jgi:hypothetical protein